MIKKQQAKAKVAPKKAKASTKKQNLYTAYYETAGTINDGYKVSRGGVRYKKVSGDKKFSNETGAQTRRPAPKGGQTRRFKRRELPAGK